MSAKGFSHAIPRLVWPDSRRICEGCEKPDWLCWVFTIFPAGVNTRDLHSSGCVAFAGECASRSWWAEGTSTWTQVAIARIAEE